jgi:hypothetical protein
MQIIEANLLQLLWEAPMTTRTYLSNIPTVIDLAIAHFSFFFRLVVVFYDYNSVEKE